MNRLTLIYPKDFEEIVSEAIAIAHITGLATQTDSENNTIIVSPIPNGSSMKSIFTKIIFCCFFNTIITVAFVGYSITFYVSHSIMSFI